MTIPAIDLHTHVVPVRLPDYVGRHADVPWPSVRQLDACHAHVMVQGKVYRPIERDCWDGAARLAAMAEMEVQHQALSPMPELLSYWLDADDATVLAAAVNEAIAALVQAHPERFTGLGMVALQEPERAARQLADIAAMGLKGVEIGSNVNGRAIGDPMFEPFFAEAEASGMAVFVHALRPAGMDRLVGPPALEQVVAFPSETALSVASVLTGGLLHRHPRLRLAFSHGGGGFALTLPRLEHAWNTVPALRELIPESPRRLTSRLWFDSLVYDETALAFLIDSYGASQVVLGTDYPFKIMEIRPRQRLDRLSAADQRAVLCDNVCRFLNIEAIE